MKRIIYSAIFILTFCFFAFGQTQNNPNCPEIKITGPSAVVQPGETMTFTVNVSDVDSDKIEYQWSVDKGTIMEGQGTPVITVNTEGLNETAITATVEIKGLPNGCVTKESESGIVDYICRLPIIHDEFGKLSKNDEKYRLSTVVSELKEKKEFIAYIILYHPANKKSYENRVARIKDFLIRENKISSERVVIINGGEEPEERTRIYLFPAGVEPPTP